MKEKRKIVLGPPYDGAYIWLINKDLMNHDHGSKYRGGHPYYKLLYGKNHDKYAAIAISLSLFYDEVLITPADFGLPERERYTSGDQYYNPLIGLNINLNERWKIYDELDNLSRKDYSNDDIRKILPDAKKDLQLQLLNRINYQFILAQKHNAKILAGSEVKKIFELKVKEEREKYSQSNFEKIERIKIIDKYFELTCLEFKAFQYDDLIQLRNDSLIKSYSEDFNKILDNSVVSDPTASFLELAIESLNNRDFAKKVKKGFSISGRIATWGGLIPLIGSLASGVGITSNIGQNYANKEIRKESWFLLGPRISEIMVISKLLKQYNV